jgi:hypothetical protein
MLEALGYCAGFTQRFVLFRDASLPAHSNSESVSHAMSGGKTDSIMANEVPRNFPIAIAPGKYSVAVSECRI